MKVLCKLICFALMAIYIPTTKAQNTKYKCMIQMNSYQGDGAYIVVSLVDPKGVYEKTLYILGADKKWYKDWKEWYKFSQKKKENLSAVTGASVTGGDRSVKVIEIEDAKVNKGYTLRFESAVEDKPYYVKDVEVPLTSEALGGKTDGTGFIKYARFSKVQ
ncbi:MAG: DUF2271 domain-containing protein [Pseudopedobacter saltans]|uniref:DUF2271 domain-containing protein n=1 Tax=Pseudopedobacter saltans TaxID=151895 RepID=A0A2W5F615_9SPHI|nr:MAG: DUF2271 domain-containing protein [Pseudopedobacter saltans]